jgi:prepilin-type N-terminal cleavage/methylation domain-containing protein
MTSQNKNGFTIVELLIVIVVIGILAAITIVAYNGVQSRARAAALMSALNSTARILKSDYAASETYPATLAVANNGVGVNNTSSVTYQYAVGTNNATFCLTASNGTTAYHVDSAGNTASVGACGVHGGPVTDGLIAWWRFNGNANDDTSYANHGAITNAVLTTGKNGTGSGAYNFNGVDRYISFGNSTLFNQPDISFTAWIKPVATSGLQEIIAKELQYKLRLNGSSLETLVSNSGTAWNTTITASASLSAGSWQHVAVTIDSVARKVIMYKDGAALNNTTFAGPITAFNTRTVFAATHSPNAEMFNGDMDDLRIYNRALLPTEVQSIMNDSNS